MSSTIGPATVYVVDDDEDVRASVCMLAESVGLNALSYQNAQAFLDDDSPDKHGCLIADIRMPGMSGLELQTRLSASGSNLPVIILSGVADVPIAVRAMKQGAIDFVEKPYQPDELLERIHKAIESDTLNYEQRRAAADVTERISSLTQRERQVMDMLAQGSANKVVAIDLGISERTVEIHRSRVMKKMGIRSVAQLVRLLQQCD